MFARKGYRVTGIDISQAMLDQARREAAGTPIELIQADLANLPLPSESCDTLLSLNVFMHFPHWREVLREWVRVVRPSGRLIFDVHSMDHVDAVARWREVDPRTLLEVENRPETFVLRLRARELAAEATRLGTTVVALVPYHAIFHGASCNFWLSGSAASGPFHDRLLSWFGVDERLFAFGRFLEERCFGALTTRATGRYMVVLAKEPDDGRNDALLRRMDELDEILANRPTLARLQPYLKEDVTAWRRDLADHLGYRPNLVLLSIYLSAAARTANLDGLIAEAVGPATWARLCELQRRRALDDALVRFAREWYTGAEATLAYDGVDLADATHYPLMGDLLDAAYFRGRGVAR
jgi:SAM-dependent methyltransferase